MRIDVYHHPAAIDRELDVLYQRLHTPGERLFGIDSVATNHPNLVLRYREADGEYYVYVEDTEAQCLAGYTVFNRLSELDKRADGVLRSPHSKYAPAYQRRGIASGVYRWALDAGHSLISGARQSAGANALWHALARSNDMFFVDVRAKALRYLGHQVSRRVHDDLYTRMMLLGRETSLAQMRKLLHLEMNEGAPDVPHSAGGRPRENETKVGALRR